MTGTYLPAAAEYIRGSLRHEVTARAVLIPFEPIALDLEDIGITFAEDWAPHVQASLTVPAVGDDLYDLLDPQKRCKIQIDAGYTYPDNVTDVQPLAVLYLRSRGVNRPDDTVELTASSAEALAQDAKLAPWASWTPDRTGLNEWVLWLATYAMYPETPVFVSTYPAGSAADAMADIPVAAGMDCWSLIQAAAARTGTWIYVDGYGRWIVTGRPIVTVDPFHTISTGDEGTAFDTKTLLSREGFANSCLITYRWKEGTVDKLMNGYAEIDSGPLAPSAAGRMGDATEAVGPISQAAANQAAASRLANLASRGRSVLVEAHAAYWLRPSQTIETQLQTGPPEKVLVRSVSFAPLTGSMNITTRQAITVPMRTGE